MVDLLSYLDPILLFWALMLNMLGYWLKRTGLPKWCPPLPLLLYIVALVPCLAFGWAHADGASGKAALYALLYGVSNAGLITLPAVWGYDVIHAFTKKRGCALEYEFIKDDGLPKKMKAIVYSVSALVGTIGGGLIASLAMKEPMFYVICWSILYGFGAFIIARMTLHLVYKDSTPQMWGVTVDLLIALGSWLGLILCTSWILVSVFGAVGTSAIIMAFGVRFLRAKTTAAPKCERTAVAEEAEADGEVDEDESDLAYLRRTLRYLTVDGTLGGDPDPNKPICNVGGVAMTCDEADAAGYGAIAGNGIEMLKELLAKGEE